jgi:hypothetical protein
MHMIGKGQMIVAEGNKMTFAEQFCTGKINLPGLKKVFFS